MSIRRADIVPGKPLFFATTMSFARIGRRSARRKPHGAADQNRRKSRPSCEPGRNEHLSSGVDPDAVRPRPFAKRHVPRSHADVERGAGRAAQGDRRNGVQKEATGVRILSEPIISPSLAQPARTLLRHLPQANWHVYEPIHRDAALQGTQLGLRPGCQHYYDFRQADVVLSLDDDFLSCRPASLRDVPTSCLAARTHDGRSGDAGTDEPPVRRGDRGDHHWRQGRPPARTPRARNRRLCSPRRHETWSCRRRKHFEPARKVGIGGRQRSPTASGPLPGHGGRSAAPGRSSAGPCDQRRLGNVGKTVFYTEPIEDRPEDQTSLCSN